MVEVSGGGNDCIGKLIAVSGVCQSATLEGQTAEELFLRSAHLSALNDLGKPDFCVVSTGLSDVNFYAVLRFLVGVGEGLVEVVAITFF